LHKLALAQRENDKLQAALAAATERKSRKRKRIQARGSLVIEEGQRLTALKEFGARSDGKKGKKQVRAEGSQPSCYEHEQRPRGCTVMYGRKYYKAAQRPC
jgi:hypothetical protein